MGEYRTPGVEIALHTDKMNCLVSRMQSWTKDYIRLAFWPVTQSVMCAWALILLDGSDKSVCKVWILFPVQVSLSRMFRVFSSGVRVQVSLSFNWSILEAPSASEGKWGLLLPLPKHPVLQLTWKFSLPWWRKDTLCHAWFSLPSSWKFHDLIHVLHSITGKLVAGFYWSYKSE